MQRYTDRDRNIDEWYIDRNVATEIEPGIRNIDRDIDKEVDSDVATKIEIKK